MAKTKLVKELMIEKYTAVNEGDWIYEAAAKIAEDRETLLACVLDEDSKLKGIITPKELLKAIEVCEYGGESHHPVFSGREALHLLTSRYAGDIMSAPYSVQEDDVVQTAIDIMLQTGFYEVPVVDDKGRVIGMINYFGIISRSVWHCDKE
ncbi:MAG: CBS domain-containing protein [Chloroflexota bacterium]|nr:CBS domain-containing protein [Chloroflexota bacterium]